MLESALRSDRPKQPGINRLRCRRTYFDDEINRLGLPGGVEFVGPFTSGFVGRGLVGHLPLADDQRARVSQLLTVFLVKVGHPIARDLAAFRAEPPRLGAGRGGLRSSRQPQQTRRPCRTPGPTVASEPRNHAEPTGARSLRIQSAESYP